MRFECEKVLLISCALNALKCTSLNQDLGGWYRRLSRSVDDDESITRKSTSHV
jgi:hypothetical protein